VYHIHGEVGDERWGWNLHLELHILVLRSSVQHFAGNCGESITRNNSGLHREFCHQGLGFLSELKHTVFSVMHERMNQTLWRQVGLVSILAIISQLDSKCLARGSCLPSLSYPNFTILNSLYL
jgi:hypothetical protein